MGVLPSILFAVGDVYHNGEKQKMECTITTTDNGYTETCVTITDNVANDVNVTNSSFLSDTLNITFGDSAFVMVGIIIVMMLIVRFASARRSFSDRSKTGSESKRKTRFLTRLLLTVGILKVKQ